MTTQRPSASLKLMPSLNFPPTTANRMAPVRDPLDSGRIKMENQNKYIGEKNNKVKYRDGLAVCVQDFLDVRRTVSAPAESANQKKYVIVWLISIFICN